MGEYGRADGIGSDVMDLPEVCIVVFGDECSAGERVVVVEHHAVDGNARSVYREPVFCGDADSPESGPDNDPVCDAVLSDGSRDGVECRVFGAPEFGFFDCKGYGDGFFVDFGFLTFCEDLSAVGGVDFDVERAGILAFRGEVHFDFAFGAFSRDLPGVNDHAVRSEVEGRDCGSFGDDEFGFAVNSAVEVHVG